MREYNNENVDNSPIILIPEQLTVAIVPEIQDLITDTCNEIINAMDRSALDGARRIVVISILTECIKYELLKQEAVKSLFIHSKNPNIEDNEISDTII